jgi:hypothetical protein
MSDTVRSQVVRSKEKEATATYPTDAQTIRLLVDEHVERLAADARPVPRRRRPLYRRLDAVPAPAAKRAPCERTLRPGHSTL